MEEYTMNQEQERTLEQANELAGVGEAMNSPEEPETALPELSGKLKTAVAVAGAAAVGGALYGAYRGTKFLCKQAGKGVNWALGRAGYVKVQPEKEEPEPTQKDEEQTQAPDSEQ